jgi:hypothetical protein
VRDSLSGKESAERAARHPILDDEVGKRNDDLGDEKDRECPGPEAAPREEGERAKLGSVDEIAKRVKP